MFEMLVRVTGFFFLFNVKLNKNSSSDIVGHNYDLTIPLIAFHLHWEEHFLMFAEWKLLHPSLPEICKGFKKERDLATIIINFIDCFIVMLYVFSVRYGSSTVNNFMLIETFRSEYKLVRVWLQDFKCAYTYSSKLTVERTRFQAKVASHLDNEFA